MLQDEANTLGNKPESRGHGALNPIEVTRAGSSNEPKGGVKYRGGSHLEA